MLYKVVDCASEWIDLDGGELSVSEYLRELLDLFKDSSSATFHWTAWGSIFQNSLPHGNKRDFPDREKSYP